MVLVWVSCLDAGFVGCCGAGLWWMDCFALLVWVLDARGFGRIVFVGSLGGFRCGDCGLRCFLVFWWWF